MSIVVRDSRKPGRKASVCSVAIVSLWLCVPPVGGNSRLVAIFGIDFFDVNGHCVLLFKEESRGTELKKILSESTYRTEHKQQQTGNANTVITTLT